MNIAIFGWYHHQNAGDDRIQACITRWLDGHTLAFLPSGRVPPVSLLRTYDAAIIGGGGLIMNRGGMFRDMARWTRRAGIPVAIAGASVERIDDDLRREVRSFLDVCCFAWFRDRGSLEAVGDHPRAFVAPDFTWLYPQPLQPEFPAEGVALCLQRRKNLPVEDWKHALSGLGQSIHPFPFYFENGGDAKLLRELLPDLDVPDEFDPKPLERSACVATRRFHGLLFGLQSGRPVLTISSTPKARRFLAEHGLEHWAIGETEAGVFRDKLAELLRERQSIRQRALEIRQQLHSEVRKKAADAKRLLLEAAEALPPPGRRPGARLADLLNFRFRS